MHPCSWWCDGADPDFVLGSHCFGPLCMLCVLHPPPPPSAPLLTHVQLSLGCPNWDIYKRRRAALQRFLAEGSCPCVAAGGVLRDEHTYDEGDAGTDRRCDRAGCQTWVGPSPTECFHGPLPTDGHFDGHIWRYCSAECEQMVHGDTGSSPESVRKLMGVLERGSDSDILRHFFDAFAGFPRLLYLSLQHDLPKSRCRYLRRAVGVLVKHHPEAFPIRSWSLVGPQFVGMFDDLQRAHGAWALQELFRTRLKWCVGVLCCAVLCCAVLCCAVLCYAVLCCAVLCSECCWVAR